MNAFPTELPRYQTSLKTYAIALVGDKDAADDLVQDCLLHAIERNRNFRHIKNVRAYLFAILRNLHIDRLRAARQRFRDLPLTELDNVPDLTPSPSQIVEGTQALRNLISLPKDQMHVIFLVGFKQLSYKEAARALNLPVGTVMSRLSRGRQTLKKRRYMPRPAKMRLGV